MSPFVYTKKISLLQLLDIYKHYLSNASSSIFRFPSTSTMSCHFIFSLSPFLQSSLIADLVPDWSLIRYISTRVRTVSSISYSVILANVFTVNPITTISVCILYLKPWCLKSSSRQLNSLEAMAAPFWTPK